jgi:Divergent InlB B-repeat domain/Bacterial Ig domain
MKKLFIIAVLLCVTLLARHAAAISQSSVYFQLGLDDLTNQDLVDANSNFVLAVSSDPTDEDANLLLAATRLLVVPQTPAGSTFLNQLGFPAAGRDIYHWTSFPPTNSAGKPQFPSGYNSGTAIAFYTNTLLPLVQASLTNLANITDTDFLYFLPNNVATGNEVDGNGGVTLDYGDVEMLRALLAATEFAGYTLSANNADVNLSQIETAILGNTLTIQSLLSTYPSLGVLQNTSALADSESAGTNAIQFYFVASDFIRNDRIDTNALFNLDPDDAGQEAKFRTELTNILESLAGPTEFGSNAGSTVDLAAYFSGTNSLRKLVPQFSGDTYVPNSVPDYTFGGILPDLPSFKTETLLTERFPNYAGIYIGESEDNPNAIYDSYGYSDGGFAVYVSTNGQLTLVGHDDENGLGNGFGIFVQTTLETGGNWSYNDSFVNASGNIDKQGNFYAQLYYPDANGVSVSLQGALQSPQGAFQNTDGLYTGSFSGSGSGTLDLIFDANGDVFYVPIAPNGNASEYGNQQQGGSGQFSSSTQFSIFSVTGTIVSGTLNPNTFVITGTYTNFDSVHGNFTVSRSSKVLFDLPPTITTDLPASLVLPIGNVATFNLGASGGAPLSYQWFFNGNPVSGATTSTLVVSNLWTVPGIYDIWATVTNVVGGTNSQVCAVTIVTETNIPTVAITAPVSGQVWSNSLFEITGTASDKVGVTGVVCSVNGTLTAVNPNPTYNNWYSLVELAPGSNSISAYSINNGFIQSKTATVLMDYVPTAPLTVITNGKGIISPNDNGQLLRIGTNYTLTATAASGFVFSSWSSGLAGSPLAVYTNKATVMFTMASNLELQANFQDALAPYLKITNATSGMIWSNSSFTVMGVATDDEALASVQFSLNGSPYSDVGTSNGWTNWSQQLTLMAGTNLFTIYAQATNNNTITNSIDIVYEATNQLTVAISGRGTISPNYSNAWLYVGQNYSMTASPAPGMIFTNWTATTNNGTFVLYGSKPTVQFMMASNLDLQANFLDTLKPYLKITNATSGMIWSNSSFTVMGVATDDEALASVQFSLNGSPYSDVGTSNGWTNWSQQLTLMAGTNLFTIYAQATNNNTITNSIDIVYEATNQLTVAISGRGTISPNYSNAWLYVGQNYSMTASPAPGMIFTNWTAATNNGTFVLFGSKPTVQFMMASNLDLQANFIDTLKPYLKITNATSGMLWSNSSFTVMGVATDDEALASVQFSLNGSPYIDVGTSNGWTNWSQQLTLAAGTNLFTIYAQATNNNTITNSINIVYVSTNQLTVAISGKGTISPNYSNAWLNVGVNYSMTASPAPGMVFTNWTAATNNGTFVLYGSKPTVQFMMASNLDLQANFIDTLKPYLKITNAISGMLWSNSSFTVMGVATDDEALASVQFSLNGSAYTQVGTSNGWTNWGQQLTLAAGTNLFTVYALATNNNAITNSINIVYVSTNQLTVAISGKGTISPNYSNAWLNVGVNYSMTASPAPGMVFTNWTAATNNGTFVLYGSKPAVQFMMASNLDLQANFLDTLKPYLKITNATSGMLWSNSSFTVMGVATDDEALASVQFSLNGSPHIDVGTSNGWTNWSQQLTLAAGTNLFTVYALATNNNTITNSINIVFVSSNQLQVAISGKGTISPNYSNAWLNVGVNYSMTASPAPGMIFTNWTASTNNGTFVLSGGKPTVQFMMASNLDLQANFLDTIKPYLKITNAVSGMLWTNPTFTVMGVATDDEALAIVQYSLNGSQYSEAGTGNGWTNWSEQLPLQAGTNLFTIYAQATNNNSITNSIDIVCVSTNQLHLTVSGRGTISPNYSNAWLNVGVNYSMTAAPAPGMIFTNWTASTNNGTFVLYGSKPAVQFMMASNLDLQANFLDTLKPYIKITNATSVLLWTNPSFTVMGVATDDEAMAVVNYSFNGSDFTESTSDNGWTNWSEKLSLNEGTNTFAVYALATNGNVSATNMLTIIRYPTIATFLIASNSDITEPQAQIAFDGTNYLVVYQKQLTNGSPAFGQFVSQAGTLLGAPLDLNTNGSGDPACVDFDGSNYLVAWADDSDEGAGVPIRGVLVSPDTNQPPGSVLTLSQSGTVKNFNTIVYGGGVYFLMWNDDRTTPPSIYGAIVNPLGTNVSGDFEIGTNGQTSEVGQPAAAFDGTDFLTVWASATNAMNIKGQLIDTSGNLVGNTIVIYTNSAPAGDSLPCVVFDGTKYLVLFNTSINSTLSASSYHILGRFVTPIGGVLTNQITLTTDGGPQVIAGADFDGLNYLVSWNQGFNPFAMDASATIYGRFLDMQGNPTTSEFPIFTTQPGAEIPLWAPVYWDGSKFVLVGGFGHMLHPAPNLQFTNGVIDGSFVLP